MRTYVSVLFILLSLILVINFSYLGSSGILIPTLSQSKIINYKNATQYHVNYRDPISLSSFRMEKLISDSEAFLIAKKVHELNDLWIKRNAAMSTLGTASYLDGSIQNDYIKLSKKSNVVMKCHFEHLLSNILKYFQSRTTATVKYRDDAAFPGFHIFECNQLFSIPVASVHKDMQYLRLKYNENESIDTKNTLSFTLAIELPEYGGGLYTFDTINLGFLDHFIPKPLVYSFAKKEKIEYKTGYIVSHNGQTFHMIAPCQPSKTKKRITLQGHGVYEKLSNTWYLYW
jgi:hypothetical protein